MIKFYDTNAVLELQEEIFKECFYISSTTLFELEHIKTSQNKTDETKFKARHIVRLLDEKSNDYFVKIYTAKEEKMLIKMGLDINSPDNQICACAKSVSKKSSILFVSDDILCKQIARNCFGLEVSGVDPVKDEIYKGYKHIVGNTDEINEQMQKISLNTNEYLIIENTDDETIKEMRFDGESLVSLKLPPSRYIKAKNPLQRCALDILMNPEITVAAILGGYGSGKTYLSLLMALYEVKEKGAQSKILGIREPRGEGKEIGYLPGSKDEKTDMFFLPLAQQLDNGVFELEELKNNGMLESNIPFYLKGTTYNNTIIVVDEAEDLNEKQIRLVGTRIGENSRIFLAGDYKQSLINASEHNALVKMCNGLKGNPKFGCIYLGEDVRSATSKMFAELFNN